MILYNDDCLNVLKGLEDNSIDLILQDPPYNTTACKWEWDIMTKIEEFWKEWNRVIKPNGAIVMFGSEPFSSKLRLSNLKNYKYDWIWDKKIPSGMSYAKYQPMRRTELISVFYKGTCNYYPQMVLRDKPIKSGGTNYSDTAPHTLPKNFKKIYTHKNPTNILEFDKIRKDSLHPTQKPVALLEYLIKTYTQENETVFDGFSGSCSTGIACLNTNRQFIGVELDEHYYTIGKQRVDEHIKKI